MCKKGEEGKRNSTYQEVLYWNSHSEEVERLDNNTPLTLHVNVQYTQARMLRKQEKISRSVFLTFTIYFVSEQGNRFGAKVISLGYLGYLNFQTSYSTVLYFLSFLKLSVWE